MNLKAMMVLLICLFAVILSVLALQNLVGGDWATVGQNITVVIVALAFFGVVVAAAIHIRG
jgi:hypothetical protein